MNSYGLPATYNSRLEPKYFNDDLPNAAEWQADVYHLAAQLARQAGVKRLVDVGCGRGGKLMQYAGEFQTVGIDYGANIEVCKQTYPDAIWFTNNLETETLPKFVFDDSVVICADVIEHLPHPDRLIEILRRACETAACVLLSTPDRARIHGSREHNGPPVNPAHVREWSNTELKDWLRSEKLPLVWWGWTISNQAYPDQFWTSLVVMSKTRSDFHIPSAFEQAGRISVWNKPPASTSSPTLKVWMSPTPSEAAQDTTNAIHQVVLRLQKHLPTYGIELVEHLDNADLRVAHAGQASDIPVDVAHYHGLYPTGMGMDGVYFAINSHVIHNLKTAKAITAPSNWIADVLRRDMHVNPHVIGWGVDTDEWQPSESRGYALWNKARRDLVSDPAPMQELAARAKDVPFLSTFGNEGENVKVIGRQPYERMKEIVRGARVYLSTNVETFGIGILEACAAGVPILGFRQGAIADYIQHGVHGYLAEPGDMDGLLKGLRYCLKHRAILGANARELAKSKTWDMVARQMAAVYRSVLEPHQGAKCSVIIPCHNYAQYVGGAIESALAQETTFDYEVIVVLDRCTDNSAEVVARYADKGVKAYPVDFGSLSMTRNFGAEQATGEHIAFLDADDHIGNPHFLQTLSEALDADRTLGIAFTSITLMNAEGQLGRLNPWPNGYDMSRMVVRQNQIPSLNLMRKEAWRRAGGFRPWFRYAEDAEFWLTVLGIGYTAKHVVHDGWFHYRLHNQSASQVHRTGEVREPDWTEFHPWTKDDQRPFAADGKAPHGSWPVRFYNKPDVSVIIPVGPGHEMRVKDALHSVEGQTHRFWECIVVNDSGKPLGLENGYPWAQVIDTSGCIGAGAARNRGAKQANAPFLVFLDADDLLKPRFLEQTLKAYRQHGRYAYSDWMTDDGRGKVEVHPTPEYSFGAIWERPSIHAITALIPRRWFAAVGGFDEKLPTLEDVDFFMKLLTHGFCGVRVPEPLLTYNMEYGYRRKAGEAVKETFKKVLIERYGAFMRGETMCNCVEPPKGLPPVPPSPENVEAYKETYGEMVKIALSGEEAPLGQATFIGPATRVNYGRRARGDVFYVWEADANYDPTLFTRVENYIAEPEPTVEPPVPTMIVDTVQQTQVLNGEWVESQSAEEIPVEETVTTKTEIPTEPEADPLEEMTKAELKKYAADHGIDLSGTTDKPSILNRIRGTEPI